MLFLEQYVYVSVNFEPKDSFNEANGVIERFHHVKKLKESQMAGFTVFGVLNVVMDYQVVRKSLLVVYDSVQYVSAFQTIVHKILSTSELSTSPFLKNYLSSLLFDGMMQ